MRQICHYAKLCPEWVLLNDVPETQTYLTCAFHGAKVVLCMRLRGQAFLARHSHKMSASSTYRRATPCHALFAQRNTGGSRLPVKTAGIQKSARLKVHRVKMLIQQWHSIMLAALRCTAMRK